MLKVFHCLSSGKNLIIKILKQQMMETHSRVAQQNVSEMLAWEHPERVRGSKHMRQLYSSQNLLLSAATFSPGMGTDQGKKCRLQRQQQAGPAWEARRQSVLGWSWGQARASRRRRVQASVGGATSTLPTCRPMIYYSLTETKEWMGAARGKNVLEDKALE